MERWKKRPGANHEHTPGDLSDAVRDADAVQGTQFERPQYEKIQRSLEKVGLFEHAIMISAIDIDCQYLMAITWAGVRPPSPAASRSAD
jgi:hypothetical protein